MKPERIGLTTLELGLFEWVVLLKTGMQAVQRTYAFANFAYATDFAAVIGELAEEHQPFRTSRSAPRSRKRFRRARARGPPHRPSTLQ